MSVKTKLPKWLTTAIKKYSNATVENVVDIFDAYFEENEVESPRFEKLIKRLLKRKTIKQKFYDILDAQGRFDLEDDEDEDVDTDDSDDTDEDEASDETDEDDDTHTDEDDSDEDSAEDEDDTDEDDDSVEDDDDSDEATDEDEDDDTSEDSDEDADDDDDTAEDEEEIGYAATGIPTLEEVTALVSTKKESYDHREEYEDPTDLLITVRTLETLGFKGIEFDSRIEGSIKRPRGGKFVLDLVVRNKKAVKRRGKRAPVFAFTDQIVEAYNEERDIMIDALVTAFTSEESDED